MIGAPVPDGVQRGEASARPTLAVASARATVAATAGYLPGFFVPLAIGSCFGANAATDAFFLALSVASLVTNSLGATTQQASIPFLVSARRREIDLGRYIGGISVSLLLLAALSTVALDSVALAYVKHRAHWPVHEQRLLLGFLLALIPFIACSVLAGVCSGALNADHKYVRVAASPAMRSSIVLAAMLAAPLAGLYAVVCGYVLGEFVRFLYLLRNARRRDRIRLCAWPDRASLPGFSGTAVAQMLGSGMLAFLPLLDRTMATRLAFGAVSILDYADRLWQVPLGFAISGFMVTSLAHWSDRLHAGGSVHRLSKDTARVAWSAAAILCPPCLVFYAVRQPLMATLFRFGRFTPGELRMLTGCLTALVAATPIYVAGLVYSRAFVVLKRSDWLLVVAVVDLIAKVGLNLLLIRRFGVVGLAASTAVTFAFSSALLMGIFHLRLDRLGSRAFDVPAETPA